MIENQFNSIHLTIPWSSTSKYFPFFVIVLYRLDITHSASTTPSPSCLIIMAEGDEEKAENVRDLPPLKGSSVLTDYPGA